MPEMMPERPAGRGARLPASVKALLSQLAAWALALALLRGGLVDTLWSLALAQCIAATLAARLFRSDVWWYPIHLAFAPALVAVHRLGIAPGWYLAAFIAMALVFWTTYRTRVPLYLSGRMTCDAVLALLPSDRPCTILDIGSGTGSMLLALAARRPDCSFTGIETAPAPWLLSLLQARNRPGLTFRRGNFFKASWSGYDTIYAFLSPEPMGAVGRKAARELGPNSIFISNSFPIPGCTPSEILEIPDRRRTRLFVYCPSDLIKIGK